MGFCVFHPRYARHLRYVPGLSPFREGNIDRKITRQKNWKKKRLALPCIHVLVHRSGRMVLMGSDGIFVDIESEVEFDLSHGVALSSFMHVRLER